MEPEAKTTYFGPLPVTEHAPGPGLAHPPLNAHPQPILHQPMPVEQDGASEKTNSDWRQKQSMQPLLGAVPSPGTGSAYPAPRSPPPILHQPVVQDGSRENWMPQPQGPPRNCPPGLEYLSMVDQLVVYQKVDRRQLSEIPNTYKIRNNQGQDVYFAREVLIRTLWGFVKPGALDLTIFDNSGNEVIHLHTPSSDECCSRIHNLEVSAPPGNLIGTVQREPHFGYVTFAVKNVQGDTLLRIECPSLCRCFYGHNQEYRITTPDGSSEIGNISKLWTGFMHEMFTYADNFHISFPVGSDVATKAILLGALFFIDILYYERTRGNN